MIDAVLSLTIWCHSIRAFVRLNVQSVCHSPKKMFNGVRLTRSRQRNADSSAPLSLMCCENVAQILGGLCLEKKKP